MATITLPEPAKAEQKGWLAGPIAGVITPALILISLITLLSAVLHLYNIQTIGISNAYYTAAVKSMLLSWHNFFFVAAEPGGSVTVDKPPLGFWIETAFAAVLGVSGFSTALPNILAGVISVPVLYHLIKKYFGAGAGLAAAFVLALTPVSLAVDRNNTIDGMLILTLLLAAWAFINATETGRLRSLLLGAFLVGLGFNIKMMQAFLPLPAFYALYFFGAKTSWRRKAFNLLLASALLVATSFAWAVAVDLTPAGQRPYVGSTSTNSEMELIFGYNGANRLLGMMGGGMRTRNGQPTGGFFQRAQPSNVGRGAFGRVGQPASPQQGNPQQGSNPPGFNGGVSGGRGGQNGGGMFNTGTPGVLRFFQAPLAKEMSWLLPFGLVVLLLSAVSGFIGLGRLRRFRLPLLSDEHKALVLWGGWLATCLVFFSIAGFFHNYYLGTVAPALAAVVGMGFFTLLKLARLNRWIAAAALLAAAGVTLAFQLYLVGQFGLRGAWTGLALGLLGLAAVIAFVALLLKSKTEIFFRMATVVTLAAMMVIPAIWSARTVAANASSNLPEAYTGDGANSVRSFGGFGGGAGGFNAGSGAASSLVSFLEANTKNIKYLVAVPSSQTGSNLVLETGRAVLFMGGFTGSDPVVDAASLAKLVASGELRYILYGGMGGGPGGSGGSSNVGSWIQSNCSQVTAVSTTGSGMRGGLDGGTLYQCGG